MSENPKDPWSLVAELEEAVDRGDADAVRVLLQTGADPEAVEDLDDPTLLMRAAEQGKFEVVKALVEGGADVNAEAEDSDLDGRYGRDVAEAVPGVCALLYAGLNHHDRIYDFLRPRTDSKLQHRVEQILKVVNRLKAPRSNNRGAKVLCDAARRGDLEDIRKKLANAIDVNAQDRSGFTALTSAAAINHREIVAFLLDAGADVDVATNEGVTALHCAKDPQIIQALLGHGADPNRAANYGHRPLHLACGRQWDERQARALVNAGADVNATNESGETPLHLAAEFASAPVVALLLSAGADIGARNERGSTSLELAWGRRDRETALAVVEILREAGAVPPEVRQLVAAAAEGDSDKVRKLVASGIDVDQPESLPADPSLLQTALHAASQAGHIETVRVLLAARADVGATTSECSNSQRSGWTPLRLAAAAGSAEVIRILCDAGADVEANATWAVEMTPLMEAAERGDVKMVEALLAAGADASRTCWGSSAADLASTAGHTDVAALLRKV